MQTGSRNKRGFLRMHCFPPAKIREQMEITRSSNVAYWEINEKPPKESWAPLEVS
jgi:hypothetical protein